MDHDVAEISGQAGMPGEGPFFILHFRFRDGAIHDARFQSYGCPSVTACGNFLVRWLEGRAPEQTSSLQPDDLVKILSLPLGKEHTAQLAVTALRRAVDSLNAEDGSTSDE
jgi:NifU-like protein involved in Fe-S cluster formation